MKKIIKSTTLLGLLLISLVSCDKFLEEKNYSSVTDETYITDEAAYEELVTNVYSYMRYVGRLYPLAYCGTDIYTRPDQISGEYPLYDYSNLTADQGDVYTFWKYIYIAINKVNTVINRSDDITDLDDSLKAKRNSEVRTLRAYLYFRLVQQYGGVPIDTTETQTAETNYVRSTEEEVYSFIIKDLQNSIPNLPSVVDEFGRVSKGMAEHLLALVYLTRGYTDFAGSDDFKNAAALAETVISSGVYSLVDSYANLMSEDNQINDEVIFSIQWTTDLTYNGDGNDKHTQLKFYGYGSYPGMANTSDYGYAAYHAYMPTDYFFTLYSDYDAREDETMHRAIYAVTAYTGTSYSLAVGDTAIYFPKYAWTDAQKAAVHYYVFNPDEHLSSSGITNVQWPLWKKFDDSNAVYGEGGGTRDTYVFRLAETYLIAAEAYFNMNNLSSSLEKINVVRRRAAKTGYTSKMELTTADLSIDTILDEYARELGFETPRWEELKRTGKLIERALKYNPHVAYHNTIDKHHLLRPIPQTEIDLSGGSLTQNDGY
jgi:starch-binding outer membrane protein, SusD/RagB family